MQIKNLTKLEIVSFVNHTSPNTQKHFKSLIQTTSDTCYSFLKTDFLTMCLEHINIDQLNTIAEVLEAASEKSREITKEAEKTHGSFWWGLKETFAKVGPSVILGIDATKMPVTERLELGDAMLLAGLYFNTQKQ